mmetsp:Transcript_17383/g.25777  ORF Transcript_17383/g.25777 Transcript_17383/m.25777 type:complete len:245 (+) Transcript_17383:49-783(+)
MDEFDVNDGNRQLVTGEIAENLVSKCLTNKENHRITKICLSNKSYDDDAAAVIAASLSEMENITHADLSDVIAGRPEEMALNVLSILSRSLKERRLLSLDLSDNAMGEKGILACKGLLENQRNSLESLSMCNNGLSGSAMELIKQIVIGETPQKSPLKKLHFFNNMSGNTGAKALADMLPLCSKLENLRFSSTRALFEGSLIFLESLAECPAVKNGQLTHLDLADNTFRTEGGLLLAKILIQQV